MIAMNPHLRTTNTGPVCERILVTPDRASEWLEKTNTNNRKVSEKHVERLARDMTEGKWVLSHSAIAFSHDGTLLDGQHRLWAVVESGVSVEMFVWRGVEHEAMMTIDCGKTRSMADILNIAGENGEVNHHQLAALRGMLGGFGNPPILSPSETSKALREHQDAIEFAIKHLPTVASARGVCNATTRAVVARAYYSVDPERLASFCRKLATGIVSSDDESIIVLLRQHLQENRGSSFSRRVQRYGKVQRVLSAWLKGENPCRIYPASAERFPLPGEVSA